MSEVLRRAAILVAGGTGERFGQRGGKQLALVAGRPVASWALSALDSAGLDVIALVCPSELRERFEREVAAPAVPRTLLVWAPSGATRRESVKSGLEVLPESVTTVVVHDGARPLVTAETVKRAIAALEESDAQGAVVGHPSYDTLKQVEGGRIISTPDRSKYWAVQTPQAFARKALERAHAAAEADGFEGTDDAALLERNGGTVLVVEGPRDNVKVTVSADLVYVEALLRHRDEGVS